jgi:NitT/TauT family transport system substrate-binding protein
VRTLRFLLNTFISGPQAWFFIADDRGYFRDEGIAIEFVAGDTLANAVPRVASGEFDVGYGDLNALVELAANATTPPAAIGVFATFNQSPYTIAVPAQGPITAPIQLDGKRIASHPNDAAMKMWPEYSQAAGVRREGIRVAIDPAHHRDILTRMLRETAYDGLFGFVNTIRSAALEAGIDAARELRFLEYRHVVPELYGAAVLVGRTLAEQEPALVRGLVRAINRGLVDTIADLDGAIDAVARRDPAIDRRANHARLAGTLTLEMGGDEGARLGIGDIDDARLVRAAALIVAAKGYARVPSATELFSRQFLPPLSERVRDLATR